MRSTCGVLERVFGYAWHTRSDKREFFQYVSPHDLAQENVRCAILLISSLLAMTKMIPVLKTPFKESFWLCVACAEC